VNAWSQHGAHVLRGVAGLALGPFGGPSVLIEAYEVAVRSVVAAQQDAARSIEIAPVRSLLALCADLTRDVGAVQASAARWVLEA
jgi:hypothetical protein